MKKDEGRMEELGRDEQTMSQTADTRCVQEGEQSVGRLNRREEEDAAAGSGTQGRYANDHLSRSASISASGGTFGKIASLCTGRALKLPKTPGSVIVAAGGLWATRKMGKMPRFIPALDCPLRLACSHHTPPPPYMSPTLRNCNSQLSLYVVIAPFPLHPLQRLSSMNCVFNVETVSTHCQVIVRFVD